MAMERLANFSDELTVGRSSVRYGVRDTGWTWWLDLEQLTEGGGLGGLKCVVGEWCYFTIHSGIWASGVFWEQEWCGAGGFSNSLGESIL